MCTFVGNDLAYNHSLFSRPFPNPFKPSSRESRWRRVRLAVRQKALQGPSSANMAVRFSPRCELRFMEQPSEATWSSQSAVSKFSHVAFETCFRLGTKSTFGAFRWVGQLPCGQKPPWLLVTPLVISMKSHTLGMKHRDPANPGDDFWEDWACSRINIIIDQNCVTQGYSFETHQLFDFFLLLFFMNRKSPESLLELHLKQILLSPWFLLRKKWRLNSYPGAPLLTTIAGDQWPSHPSKIHQSFQPTLHDSPQVVQLLRIRKRLLIPSSWGNPTIPNGA